ncbi:DUF1140 family protein, partial [Enterococcus faecium]|nr:DUF1140 family protein [Enterococcus faecium]MBG8154550.1 DUF1140 family protein [Enterococcus faecium]MCH3290962.1 DUF1140 family protein [Enterococcus faecium]MCH3309899.1 DUF1140 family protein [Enterococcus faecium]MCH3313783.1 DUF1140 family protein [Enterococcus faecium]
FDQMRELDRQTNWSKKLHQDRFKFVEKYKEILEEYLRRTANDKKTRSIQHGFI